MRDTQAGKIIFECDCCDEVLETEEKEWDEAKAKFREAGWRAKQIAAEWVHGCPQHAKSI